MSRIIGWFTERWPLREVANWALKEDIPGGSKFSYVLGSATLFVFLLQVVTGIWQMFYYVPTVDHAYRSLMYLRQHVPYGWLIHGLHYWGSNAMIVLVALHMGRVFIWGAYKKPRELTWVLGAILLMLVLAESFTGALLPWDELGYWAAEVGTSIAGTVPIIGQWLKEILRGGAGMNQATLSRFFVLHVAILSGAMMLVFVLHLVAFRRYGSVGPWKEAKRKRIGSFWPDQAAKDTVFAALVLLVLIGLCAYWPAPVTGPADHIDNSITAKPEWQFLFLYQFLKLFKGPLEPVGTTGVPLVLTVLLLGLPFYDRGKQRNPFRRPVAMLGGLALLAWVVVFGILGHLSNPAAAGSAQVSTKGLAGPAKAGAKVFQDQGCLACHTVHGQGGDIGPDLSDEGEKGRSKDWLTTQIRTPKKHDPTTAMPSFNTLPDNKVSELVAYLETLGRADSDNNSAKSKPASDGNSPAGDPPASAPTTAASSAPQTAPAMQAAHNQTSPAVSPGPSGASTLATSSAPSSQPDRDQSSTRSPGTAAYLVGNPSHGKLLYNTTCKSCHGPGGTGGVSNPGSTAGQVPPLKPISRSLYSDDPITFAENIDRIIQHGSTPPGPNPAKTMPAFGESMKLTQEMICEIEAYVLKINGVDRAKIFSPGTSPKTFFLICVVIFGAAAVLCCVVWVISEPAPAGQQAEQPQARSAEQTQPAPAAEQQADRSARQQSSARRREIYFALIVAVTVAVIGAAVSLIFSQFVTARPIPHVPASRPAQAHVSKSQPESQPKSSAQSSAVSAGKALFNKQGCTACHKVNGKGGAVGPDLSDESARKRSAQWLTTQIRTPKKHNAKSIMPSFGSLTDKQVADLVKFLQSLSGKRRQAHVQPGVDPGRGQEANLTCSFPTSCSRCLATR